MWPARHVRLSWGFPCRYFASLKDILGEEWGAGEFEKESWAFKHDRLEIEKRVAGGGHVKTADVAHLLELFQVRTRPTCVRKGDVPGQAAGLLIETGCFSPLDRAPC